MPLVALAVGVTLMVKLWLPVPAASPAAMVHTMSWPLGLVQLAGSGVPMVRPAGIVSLMVDTSVVSAVPVLLTVIV